jgi:hypothetical protein
MTKSMSAHKICAFDQCGKKFIPHDGRMNYCSKECRYSANNAKRKVKMAPHLDLIKIHKTNEAILEKHYRLCEQKGNYVFHLQYLIIEGKFRIDCPTSIGHDESTNKRILKFGNYTLCLEDEKSQTYIIDKLK